MTSKYDVFDAGSGPDAAKLTSCLSQIYFPWEKLQPALQSAGVGKIRLEFADLSTWGMAAQAALPSGDHPHTHQHEHLKDADGHEIHPLSSAVLPGGGPAKAGAAGLAWYGKIQVHSGYRNDQATIDWIISAEVAHEVDFFYLDPNGLRPSLMAIAHPGGADTHEWFEGDYFSQVGEGWMSAFGAAYTDFVEPDDRYHFFPADAGPAIRAAINAERTDRVAPPTDRYEEGVAAGRAERSLRDGAVARSIQRDAEANRDATAGDDFISYQYKYAALVMAQFADWVEALG